MIWVFWDAKLFHLANSSSALKDHSAVSVILLGLIYSEELHTPTTHQHIPEDLNPQQQCCKHVTSCATLLLCRVRATKEDCLWDCLLFWVIYRTVCNCRVSVVEISVVAAGSWCACLSVCQLAVRWPSPGWVNTKVFWCLTVLQTSRTLMYKQVWT